MFNAFRTIIMRDLLLAMRRRSDVLTTLFFFVIVVSLFPGYRAGTEYIAADRPRRVLGGGTARFHAGPGKTVFVDYQDGALEQMLLAPGPCLFWCWARCWRTGW